MTQPPKCPTCSGSGYIGFGDPIMGQQPLVNCPTCTGTVDGPKEKPKLDFYKQIGIERPKQSDGFLDLPEAEQRDILEKAATGADKRQQAVIDEYEAKQSVSTPEPQNPPKEVVQSGQDRKYRVHHESWCAKFVGRKLKCNCQSVSTPEPKNPVAPASWYQAGDNHEVSEPSMYGAETRTVPSNDTSNSPEIPDSSSFQNELRKILRDPYVRADVAAERITAAVLRSLPERMTEEAYSEEYNFMDGWNACLDQTEANIKENTDGK